MKNIFPYQLITLFFVIFVACFVLAFYALGWTEPTVAPPGGSVDVPVNVGAISQIKSGAFGVQGVFQADGGSGSPVLTTTFLAGEGRVGIGTDTPNEKLHVVGGDISVTNGDVCQTAGGITNCLSSAGGTISLTNCTLTGWSPCGAASNTNLTCGANQVVNGIESVGCAEGGCADLTRCEKTRIKCCDITF